MDIWIGSVGRFGRRQAFADGELVICSRKGVHPSEEALLSALPRGRTGSALVVNSVEGLAGMALRALNPELDVHCHFDDAWDFEVAQATVKQQRQLAPKLGLAPDPPEGPWDIVALPFSMAGVADLLRERLAFALKCLKPGGLLFTSTDNRSDRFLRDAVVELFGSATTVPGPLRRSGVAYVARRRRGGPVCPPPDRDFHRTLTAEPVSDLARSETGPRERDFRRTFTVREGEGVLSFVSRPGIFCHGRLDSGTKALLSVAEPGDAKLILDLGCGVGVLGLVAALRCPNARVSLVDSHARAIECAQANAAALGVQERVRTLLTADPLCDLSPGFDLALSNPPYYGNYRIAEMFLDTAAKVLVPGGRIVLVTKGPEWFTEAMGARFSDVEAREVKGYWVIQARQPAHADNRRTCGGPQM